MKYNLNPAIAAQRSKSSDSPTSGNMLISDNNICFGFESGFFSIQSEDGNIKRKKQVASMLSRISR